MNTKRRLHFVSIVALPMLALATTATAAPYADTVLNTPGLVGYWRLDEAAGDAQDATANTNNGVYTDAVQRQQSGPAAGDGFPGFGASNPAAGFPGGGSRVDIADSDILDIRTGDLTVEAWVRVDGTGTLLTAVAKMGRETPTVSPFRLGYSLSYRPSTGNMELNARNVDLGLSAVAPMSEGAWHHVVGVIHPNRDGGTSDEYTASGATLFLDGTLANTVASSVLDGSDLNSTFPLIFGAWAAANNFPWIGQVDEVAIYSRALSSLEVAEHHTAALIPEPASLVLMGIGGLLLMRRRVVR